MIKHDLEPIKRGSQIDKKKDYAGAGRKLWLLQKCV